MSFEKSPQQRPEDAFTSGVESRSEQETVHPGFEEFISEVGRTDVTVYEKLNATNLKQAREEFLADSMLVHPNFVYGNLDPKEVATNLATLDLASETLAESDFSDKEQRFARIVIEDYRRANDFLAANIAYNSAQTSEEKADAAEYHREANEAYYGKPDEATFYALLEEQLAKIHPDQLRREDQATYQSLLDAIGPIESVASAQRFKPRVETVKRFSELVHEFYSGPLSHIPANQDTFTPAQAADIVNQILHEEIGDTAYRATVAPERANAGVDHIDRLITFPGSRAKGDYNRRDLETIIVHELGAHVYRAINYEGHPISAFSHGLPGNETWDEGVAKCVEQGLAGEYQDSGVAHYINIGLATFKGKNFREVFDISTMLDFLAGAKPNESDEHRAERLAKIRTANFNPTTRCFRGTGELVNNKDLAYYNGANQVWHYIEEHLDDPELFDHLFLDGKTVATDRDQASLVYETHVGGI